MIYKEYQHKTQEFISNTILSHYNKKSAEWYNGKEKSG